jgi:kynurenine formamidase
MHLTKNTRTALIALAVASTAATAQVNDQPFQEGWAPSKWGKDDSAGSANHTRDPANVKRALSVVRQFKTVTLGKYYHREMPLGAGRSWVLTLTGTPNGGPFGDNAFVFHDEMLTAEIGQVGTQFDGPGHAGVMTSKGMFFYNGRMFPQTYERGGGGRAVGLGLSGVEYPAELGFVCRAIILDAAAYRGMARLPIPAKPGDAGVVTAADVQAILKKQGMAEPQPGDCVFLHTGHGELWGNDVYKKMTSEQRAKAAKEFLAGEPGFGTSACQYLASRDIALMGGDTSAVDAQPMGEKDTTVVPCHSEMQTKRGIWNLENLDLKPLIDAKVYEFAFIWAPLKLIGATGSPANPIAIY